jgi:hypothetical protein
MMKNLNFRHVCVVFALAAFCAVAAPADGALPPEEMVLFMSDAEWAVLGAVQQSGLREARIEGTYSFFACSYGCREREDVILVSGLHPRNGTRIELGICYNRSTERIRRAPMESACRYDSGPSGSAESEAPTTGNAP